MTVLRLTVGGLFGGHGTQKLFGRFGGDGLDGTGALAQLGGALAGSALAVEAGRRLAERAEHGEHAEPEQRRETPQRSNGGAPEREPVAA